MRNRTLTYVAVTAVVVAGAVTTTMVSAEETTDPELTKALDELLADERYDGSAVGLVVADAETGDVLYDHRGEKRLTPASNTKMLTSAAAMGILGGDYRFTTDVATAADQDGDTLAGDLYLRGTGDPTMLAEDYDALAAELAEAGVTVVDGDLVADDTAYDSTRLGPEWGWDDEGAYYAAEISALTVAPDTDYDAGSVVVSVAPGAAEGDPAEVTLTPPTDHVVIDSSADTGAADGDSTVSVGRTHGTNTIVVSGSIPAGSDATTSWVAVSEPTGYAADVFAKALKANGIGLTGDVRLGESTPDDARAVAAHESMPLSELLVPFMKLSNNGHAETLIKAIGRETAGEGTWGAGLAAANEYLAELGMDTEVFRQSDGSGLSRWNLIPPTEFIGLLTQLKSVEWFDTWYESLPIACEEDRFVGGTLRTRMCDTPAESNLRGKTGSLTSASALSGYVTTADGRELVFSMVSNEYIAGSVKDIEDNVGIVLASHGGDGVSAESLRTADADANDSLECSWAKPASC